MKTATQSPISGKLLRAPGQSIDRRLTDLAYDMVLPLIMSTVVLWVFSLWEWFRFFSASPPNPLVYTAMAGVFSLYAAFRLIPAIRTGKRLKLGLEGERAVGELLDRLRAKGYRVFHDVPTGRGNIDHVIICARGIYTIETKTRRKPAQGSAVVRYDGETLSVNGSRPCEKAIVQARAQAAFLKRYLKDRTSRAYPVRAVVVFPGWFVKRTRRHANINVWVTEPKALHQWIDRDPPTIDLADVKMAANTLSRYIRDFE
ncbi:MAG: NERD domain-containing protein [Gammaproteobacteria bacterium]|nr:NERD domain-containing protein [Gammaproteobacteria bacterium]